MTAKEIYPTKDAEGVDAFLRSFGDEGKRNGANAIELGRRVTDALYDENPDKY